jgi:hypothetical protein
LRVALEHAVGEPTQGELGEGALAPKTAHAVGQLASESATSTTYTTLTTPDQVANVVVPTDGKLLISYQAIAKNSVANTGGWRSSSAPTSLSSR